METYYGGLSLPVLLYCLGAVFLSSVVRGYSGFGLAALLVTTLSLVLPPREAVPIAIVMELLAGIVMLRQVWRDVAWPALGWLMLGAAAGTPLGVYALAVWPDLVMRLIIALLVLGSSLLLWFGLSYPGPLDRRLTLGAGLVSGFANGAAAVGGLPLVAFLASLSIGAAVLRATLSTYLLLLNGYGAAALAVQGLITFEVALRAGFLVIPLLAGVFLGNRQFADTTPEAFRRFTLGLLVALSLLALVRAFF